MEAKRNATLAERLDALPLSPFHWGLTVRLGLGWMFDAMDIALMAFVLPVIAKEWSLTPFETGWGASMALAGMLVGAVSAGLLADRLGRRVMLLSTMLLFCVCTALCGLAWSFGSLLVLRFFTGIGLGGELPVASAYMSEFAPAKHRGKLIVFLDTFWAFGWSLAAAIAFLLVPTYGWRIAFLVGGLPAVYIIYLRSRLPESPRYLLSRGRKAEAVAVVEGIERSCGVPSPAPAPEEAAAPAPSLKALFAKGLGTQTSMLWVMWFALGYTYFGIYSWLPSLLVASGHTITKSFEYTLIIALAQAPGFASAAFFIDRHGRVPTFTAYRLLLAVACWFFAFSANTPGSILLWGCLISFFGMGAWGIAYAYTAESYPTALRATGTGCATACARVGGILAPLAVGWIMQTQGASGQQVVFVHMVAVTVLGALVVPLLGRETRQRSLEALSAGVATRPV